MRMANLMTAPLALQLYSLREELTQDFAGTVRRVAAMGYAGVEPFGDPANLTEAAALYKDLGLAIPAAHMSIPLGDFQARAFEIAAAYELERIILPGLDRWESLDAVKQSADRYNDAYRACAAEGYAFGLHNHWWEFATLDGRVAFDVLLEHLDPNIFLEVDVYWVQVAGADPVQTVRDLGARASLLHIKDGPAENHQQAMLAVGDGAVDIPAIIQAGQADWLVVELDRCATDMATAVEKSFNYLVEAGLSHGR